MVGQRQLQHVLEIIRQHHVAALVRQPVGEPGDQRGGQDDEQAETDPGADQRRQRARRRSDAPRAARGQGIDNAAEQHRLDELRGGERDIGERQCHGKPRDGAQQAENAKINTDEGHSAVLALKRKRATGAINSGPVW